MGLLWNIWCIILRLLAVIISGKENLVEFLMHFPLGREVRNFQQLYKEISAAGRKLLGAEIPVSDLGEKQIHTSLL